MIRSCFHLPVFLSISSATDSSLQCSGFWLWVFVPTVFGIQLSFQMLIEPPSTTSHFYPCCTISLAPNQLFHNHELVLLCCTLNRSSFWRYLPFNTLVIKSLGSETTLQICLASTASLKVLRSLKPKPPLSFGTVSLSYAAQ